jgi:hypothetical protein
MKRILTLAGLILLGSASAALAASPEALHMLADCCAACGAACGCC